MTVEPPTSKSLFFAYAGHPALRAETMRSAVTASRTRGLKAEGWEDLQVSGRILIDSITDRINSCEACVAELSSNNSNVLFETGYALAKNKLVYLAIDESDQDAVKSWQALGLVDTIGRIEYGGNAQKLATELAASMSNPAHPLIETLLAGGRPREENTIFAPGPPHKTTSAERLERFLERKTSLNILGSQEDFGSGSLQYYVQAVYRSSAIILHFMKPSRTLASVYNSRLALIAGIAHGLDLPVLMVAEAEYQAPLDYRDLVYVYNSTAKLTEHVDEWLSVLPTEPGSKNRLGRLKLDIELPLRSFGQFVAESEKSELKEYFVHTNEFEAVLSGRASIFAGRKGTGKTATMQESVFELRKDRRNLVVPIKPSSYDLAGLIAAMTRFDTHQNREYFLLNLWSYLLVTEIAISAVKNAESLPAGVVGNSPISILNEELSGLAIDLDSDFSSRLDEIVGADEPAPAIAGNANALTSSIRDIWKRRLLPRLKKVLHDYDRVAVLIDNLDKTWERGVEFENLSHFILSLLFTRGRLETEFEKSSRDSPSSHVTLTVFLRTDIYDVVSSYAREPDKINPQTIQWTDEELLIRVLEERYEANRSNGASAGADGLWKRAFCPEVHGLPTRDYFLWRALPRPRDIIYLGNAALTTAINRRHDKVLPQDFHHADFQYSRFAVEALLVESEAQGFNLEEVLFEFAGLDATITDDDLLEAIGAIDKIETLKQWLIRTSFLGVETRDGTFVYVEGDSEAQKKYRAAQRLSMRLQRPMRYRVHPSFRKYLEISDDDLALAQDAVTEQSTPE